MRTYHMKMYWIGACIAVAGLGVGMPDAAAQPAQYTNPVIAGDYPDPSVIRVGNEYWGTATSSEWGPPFPILHSRDLVNWTTVGTAFTKRPAWSVGNYWAPELVEYNGRYFIYYVARKKDGPLCTAVASAAKPAGPYKDHGPLVCQDAGSIDGFPITDENGQRYLVWKEDGNSRNLPTPLWAQPLSKDGLKLTGEPKELIRNDAKWEAQLVEGPFIMRRDGWFYMFYAGNACCGRQCNYAVGVARAQKLLGPWEKNPANPILKASDEWKCPGHGSIVSTPDGRDFFMYHAYHAKDSVYAGRQALLDEVVWSKDGWPTFKGGKPSKRAASPHEAAETNLEYRFEDEFTKPRLIPGWQWPQANEPVVRVDRTKGGRLVLSGKGKAAQDPIGAVVARSTTLGNYVATTLVDTRGMKRGVLAGLSAFGDPENAFGVAVGGGKVVFWRREKNKHEVLETKDAPASPLLYLRMTVKNGDSFRFAVSANGQDWTDVGTELEGDYLPPWDRAVRVALTAGGAPGASAKFDWLRIEPAQ